MAPYMLATTLVFMAALLRLPLISSTAAVAGSGADKPTLTFCSSGVSPYFTSSPVVSDGEFVHFLDSLLAGAYGNGSNVVDMSYNLSSNLGENRTLHGVAQCRPDVPVSECAACLAASKQSIADAACAATAVWYDAYFLRYSDDDTSRFREKEYTSSVFNASRVLYGHAGKAVVTGLLAAVINSTVNTHTYSIGTGTAAGLVYNLARCIPGIARADCARCLRGALAVVEREYNGSAGMQVLRLSCMTRYESYPFYNASLLGGMAVVIGGIGSNVTVGPNRHASPPPTAHPMPSPPRAAHAAAPSGGRGAGLPPPSPAQAQTRSHRRTGRTLILLIVLIATGVAVGAILLFFWSHRKRRQNRRDVVANGIPGENVYFLGEEHINAEEDEDEEISASCQRYSYKILEVATCHFSNSNKLGSGGFGTVYKGTLENGEEVAVKRLKDSKRSLAELEREVSIVAKLRHENLVRFLGYCFEDEGRLLVYEYLPNNSLDKFWNKGYFQCQKLEWETWFSIIKGVARGLQFLHNKGVIHRDLKPHNVLLDELLNPKIADFDLVRVYNKDRTHESTEKVAGTFGYMAPECTSGRKSQLSIKSDVYSYGVLVLEIITGRKIHTFEGHNSEGLVEYVWQHWTERRVRDVVHSDLDVETGEQGQRQALRCVHVALLCVQSDRSRRPTMDEVIVMIGSHQDSELQEPSLPGYLHHPKPAPGRVLSVASRAGCGQPAPTPHWLLVICGWQEAYNATRLNIGRLWRLPARPLHGC